MAVDDEGVWKNPAFLGSGAPEVDVDPTAVSDYFAEVAGALFDTVAEVLAETPPDDNFIARARNAPGAVFEYVSGAWVMFGRPTFASTGARDSALTSPAAGMEAAVGTDVWRYSGSAWILWQRPPTAFTPALTGASGNPNLGSTGTAVGRYSVAAGVCTFSVEFLFGGTGIAQGSGNYSVSLPVAHGTVSGLLSVVAAWFDKAGSSKFPAQGIILSGGSTVSAIRLADGSGTQLSNAQNMGAAGSILALSGSYPVA